MKPYNVFPARLSPAAILRDALLSVALLRMRFGVEMLVLGIETTCD